MTHSLSGRHRGIASLVFSHRGSASQRISAARTRIARIFASHRIPSPSPCLARVTTHIASLPASRDTGHSAHSPLRSLLGCSYTWAKNLLEKMPRTSVFWLSFNKDYNPGNQWHFNPCPVHVSVSLLFPMTFLQRKALRRPSIVAANEDRVELPLSPRSVNTRFWGHPVGELQ